MLSQDHEGRAGPYRMRFDQLVGPPLLDEPVLVDSGGMGECIGSDNGLVRLDRHTRDTGEKA